MAELAGYILTLVGILWASYGAGTVLAATLGLRKPEQRLELMVNEKAYWNHVHLMQRCNRFMALGAILALVGVIVVLNDQYVGTLVLR